MTFEIQKVGSSVSKTIKSSPILWAVGLTGVVVAGVVGLKSKQTTQAPVEDATVQTEGYLSSYPTPSASSVDPSAIMSQVETLLSANSTAFQTQLDQMNQNNKSQIDELNQNYQLQLDSMMDVIDQSNSAYKTQIESIQAGITNSTNAQIQAITDKFSSLLAKQDQESDQQYSMILSRLDGIKNTPAPTPTPAPAPAPAPKTTTTKTTTPAPTYKTYTVKSGDSLWKVARNQLGSGASNTQVANLVNKIYANNKSVIGSNPNRIYAGQKFKV